MEKITCLFCNSSNIILRETFGENSFHFCRDCSGEFSRLMNAGTSLYYEEEADYGAGGKGYRDNKWEFKKFLEDAKKFNISGNIIDVGCGPGKFLKLVAKEGLNVFGVDYNKFAIQMAHESGLTQTRVGSIFESSGFFGNTKYDAVTLFHVLEHLEEPVRTLQFIKEILKPRGVLAIAVPNSKRSFLKINLRKRKEGWDYPPNHLTRWNKEGLSFFLLSNSFEILEIIEERVFTLAQNFEFLKGFLSFLTSTGIVAKFKKNQVHEAKKEGREKISILNFLKLRFLKSVIFAKNIVIYIFTLILLPLSYLISKFIFIKGINLYILGRK